MRDRSPSKAASFELRSLKTVSRELSGASLGALERLLGRSWALLGRSWTLLGRSWGALGRSWDALETLLGAPGTLLGRSLTLLGDLGPILAPPRVDFGVQESILEPPGIDFEWHRLGHASNFEATTLSQRQPQRLAYQSSLLRTAWSVLSASIGPRLESRSNAVEPTTAPTLSLSKQLASHSLVRFSCVDWVMPRISKQRR